MSKSEWCGYRGNVRRSSVLRDAPSLDQTEHDWEISLVDAEVLGQGLRATPDAVLIARTDGVSVLDPWNGDQIWNYTTGVPRYGIECVDGSVFLGTDEGIEILRLEDGSHIKSIQCDISPGGEAPQEILVDEDRVYAPTSNGLRAIHNPTGSELWTLNIQARELALYSDSLYALTGDFDASVHCIEKMTGDVRWATPHPNSGMGYSMLQGARPEGIVMSATETDTRVPITEVHLLGKEGGKILQRCSLGGYWDARVVETDVYLSECDRAAAISFGHGPDWRADLPLSTGGNVSALPFAILGDRICMSTEDGLFVLDRDTGDIVTNYSQAGRIEALAATGDRIYIASEQQLIAFSGDETAIYGPSG